MSKQIGQKNRQERFNKNNQYYYEELFDGGSFFGDVFSALSSPITGIAKAMASSNLFKMRDMRKEGRGFYNNDYYDDLID